MATGNTDQFYILIESETPISEGTGIHVQSDASGQVFISGVALRAYLREQFQRQYPSHGLNDAEVFGFLSESSARRSVFSISPATAVLPERATLSQRQLVSLDPQSRIHGNKLVEELVVPEGTRFVGTLAIDAPRGSPEDLAIKTALLSISHIGRYSHGLGRCSVHIEDANLEQQVLYLADSTEVVSEYARIWVPDVKAEMLAYFGAHPEKMYDIEPRTMEELIAAILRNQGFEVKLTPETRDGGFDMVAARHDIFTGRTTYLVECKRYAPQRKVGIGVVRSLMGVVLSGAANKGIIVTTSFYSEPAKKLAEEHSVHISLKDFSSLKFWLGDYKTCPNNRLQADWFSASLQANR